MKILQQLIERNFYRFLLPVARLCWFIFRPRTRGAKCLIVAEGKVLLIKNTYHRRGLWNLPGGRVGAGEDPQAAAIREVREEVGVTLAPDRVRKLGEWYTEAEYKHDTVHFYLAEFPERPEVTIDPVEIAVAEWFPVVSLPARTSVFVHKALVMNGKAGL